MRAAKWRLEVNELQQVCEFKYLGIWMSPNGCKNKKNENISMVNQWVGRLGSAARMRANKVGCVERYGRVWLFRVLCMVWKCLHGMRVK